MEGGRAMMAMIYGRVELLILCGSNTHYQLVLNPMKSVATAVVDNGEQLQII